MSEKEGEPIIRNLCVHCDQARARHVCVMEKLRLYQADLKKALSIVKEELKDKDTSSTEVPDIPSKHALEQARKDRRMALDDLQQTDVRVVQAVSQ